MPDIHDPILAKPHTRTVDMFTHLVDKQSTPVVIAPEQEAISWQHVMQSRQAIRDFVRDPTLAHNYSHTGSWRVWVAVANNTLVPDCSLSAHVNFTGQVMREIVQAVVPNRAHGVGYGDEIARDHAELELKKAGAVNRIALAGALMMGGYPGTTARHLHMSQFLHDHVASSGKWMEKAAATAKAARMPKKDAKAPSGQQNLFG